MSDVWLDLDRLSEPEADAIRLDFVVDDDLGIIASAVTADGRRATAAEPADPPAVVSAVP